jgi:hypothetical protein
LDVLNFTAAPALDWGAGTNGGDRIVFPAIRPATIRMHPLGSIVAMLRSAKVPQAVIDGFRVGGDAQLCENEDPVLVTAVPLLHKEARVMSFLRRIPDKYGFESPDAYYADFSARYELVDGVPEMVWCDDDEGELRSDELFAELCFCDDGDERVRRLWPASLLIGPAGATEIPAATTEAKAAGMLTDLADDLRRYPRQARRRDGPRQRTRRGQRQGKVAEGAGRHVRRPDDDEGRGDPPRVAVAAPGAAAAAPRDHRGGPVNAAEAGAI